MEWADTLRDMISQTPRHLIPLSRKSIRVSFVQPQTATTGAAKEDTIARLVATAKKLGYSFDELSAMTLSTLMKLFEGSIDDDDGVREATQEDIDRLA